MPTIAYFLGISVRMFYNDHEPAHVLSLIRGIELASVYLMEKSSMAACRQASHG
jgi:hypothetical protein